ncbi:MAG: MBL fold metallo-hydrolase [Alphaproteobacteria bacterium]|nr:MBL fold metallo-hydrolase [Alphaproteobacteria bacterium]
MKITVLGSGSAYGCPMSFNNWREADPLNHKNERTRAAVLIEHNSKYFMIDAGPDFRFQINHHQVPNLDAVFITHGHYDHIGGVPELPRAAKTLRHCVEVWSSRETFSRIQECFCYLFNGEEQESNTVKWHTLPDSGTFESRGVTFTTFQLPHHELHTSCFRLNNFAYITDWQEFLPETAEVLKGLDLLMIECNNGTSYEANGHADLAMIKQVEEIIKPKRIVLTHLSARVDYEKISSLLPENWQLAYDGMVLKS